MYGENMDPVARHVQCPGTDGLIVPSRGCVDEATALQCAVFILCGTADYTPESELR